MARVLVIDDEPDVVRLVLKVLSGRGHVVQTVRDGASALTRVKQEPPDFKAIAKSPDGASWCGVCKTEKPALNAMAGEMASDDFVVVALASDHSWADALTAVLEALVPQAVPEGKPTMEKVSAAFRQALPHGAPFKVWLDPPPGDENIGKITASWGIKAVPESALIDRRGNIRAYFVNKRDWQTPVAQTCLRSVIDGD